ncbi:MAG: type II toxin-antitoxin system PemK/MazF family toxin [Candidatus Methanoperedens sp.]|nr:type II toxin-antitoxin system PemK/MazF family toxin [Candidatus Methanoperedens sp.]
MNKGEIILITFPFTDLSGSKLRPALVLAADREDITVAFITTNLQQVNNTDMLLRKSSINGLKKDSLVKMNKIATLDHGLAMGKVGQLAENELKEVDKKLVILFNIKNLSL